jgi:hypothetical protein
MNKNTFVYVTVTPPFLFVMKSSFPKISNSYTHRVVLVSVSLTPKLLYVNRKYISVKKGVLVEAACPPPQKRKSHPCFTKTAGAEIMQEYHFPCTLPAHKLSLNLGMVILKIACFCGYLVWDDSIEILPS